MNAMILQIIIIPSGPFLESMTPKQPAGKLFVMVPDQAHAGTWENDRVRVPPRNPR